jgi:hypothetical protein
VVFLVIELVESPVLEHARMEKVLIDGRELIGEHLVQMLDDLFIAFHDYFPPVDGYNKTLNTSTD